MKYLIPLSFILGFLLVSCGEEPPVKETTVTTDLSAVKHLSLSSKPDQIQTINALKKSGPKAGDAVTIQGRIGGASSPFVSSYAAFMLADDTILEACDSTDDDHCAKPWDYCCESKEKRKANIVTIQAVDEKGQVIKSDINGLDGIQSGSFVIIAGTIAEGSKADNIIVNMTGLFHDTERKIAKSGKKDAHDHKHDHGDHDHKH